MQPPGLIGPAALSPPAAPLPLLRGRVTCGFPSPAEDHMGFDELDLQKRVVRNAVATYFVEADTGQSMVGYNITPGSTLVVDRSITAKNGDIVMALWEGGFTVKRLRVRAGRYELHSGHRDYPPIVVPPDVELEIWGVVTWVFHRLHGR